MTGQHACILHYYSLHTRKRGIPCVSYHTCVKLQLDCTLCYVVDYVASQLTNVTHGQYCINLLDHKLISVLVITSCFNRFITVNHKLISVFVLTSHTNDSTLLSSALFTASSCFVWHVRRYTYQYDKLNSSYNDNKCSF